MPRSSKRIAARQAELARRKKQRAAHRTDSVAPMPAEGVQPAPSPAAASAPVPAAPAADGAASHPAAPAQPQRTTSGLPDFEVPVRPGAARPRPRAPAAAATAPQGLPSAPYLRGDLKVIGILAALMAIALAVLAIVLD